MGNNKEISRKDFIKGMGVSLAGVAVAGGLGGMLTGCSAGPVASAESAPAWPMKYEKLDPAKAEERAFTGYKEKGGWGVGVAEGFFGSLADQVGYPVDQVPTAAFAHAASGYGAGTLCGCLGVAATCIGTVTDVDTSKKLVAELFNWYETAEFPQYQPENLGLAHTVADSVLCEQSVGNFMAVQKVKYGDPERKSRCAGTTADVVRKMVELLNATV